MFKFMASCKKFYPNPHFIAFDLVLVLVLLGQIAGLIVSRKAFETTSAFASIPLDTFFCYSVFRPFFCSVDRKAAGRLATIFCAAFSVTNVIASIQLWTLPPTQTRLLKEDFQVLYTATMLFIMSGYLLLATTILFLLFQLLLQLSNYASYI